MVLLRLCFNNVFPIILCHLSISLLVIVNDSKATEMVTLCHTSVSYPYKCFRAIPDLKIQRISQVYDKIIKKDCLKVL